MPRIGAYVRAEILLTFAWALVLVRLVWPAAVPPIAGAVLMAAYIALALPRLRRRTLVLCALLASAALVLAAISQSWRLVLPALDGATIFGAFFGTIMMLRTTADQRPETNHAREMFRHLDGGQISGAFLIGAHLIGALLVVGAMAVLAPIQERDASDEERRRAAESSLRGMCMAPLWSPFWIAMAIAYQYLPAVPLWQIFAVGIPLAAGGTVLSHLMFGRGLDMVRLWDALKGLAPVVPPVALCALAVSLMTSFSNLSTLQSVAVCIPVLCGLALLGRGRQALTGTMAAVYRGLGGIADEVVLVTVALVLGRLLVNTISEAGIADWIGARGLPPEGLIAITVAAMTAAALVGIHQLVSITVILVLLAPLGAELAEVVLMEAALLGWAFASMVGISAVSVASAAMMFRVPMDKLSFGPNLKFVAVFGVVASICLMAVNRIVLHG
jgi:hypothetical protein